MNETTADAGVRRTIAAYCHAVDDGRWEDFAELWTEDAVVHVMGQTIEGRDKIRGWMEQAQPPESRGLHFVANTEIDVESADRARAVSDFVFLQLTPDGPQPSTSGRYVDELVRSGDRWRFASREIQLTDT